MLFPYISEKITKANHILESIGCFAGKKITVHKGHTWINPFLMSEHNTSFLSLLNYFKKKKKNHLERERNKGKPEIVTVRKFIKFADTCDRVANPFHVCKIKYSLPCFECRCGVSTECFKFCKRQSFLLSVRIFFFLCLL